MLCQIGRPVTLLLVDGQAAQLQQALQQEGADRAAAQEQLADAEEAFEKLHGSFCSLQQQHAALLEHSSVLEQTHAHGQQQLQAMQAEHDTLLADLVVSQDQVPALHVRVPVLAVLVYTLCML